MRQSRSTTSQITLQLSSEQCKTAGKATRRKTSAVRPRTERTTLESPCIDCPTFDFIAQIDCMQVRGICRKI